VTRLIVLVCVAVALVPWTAGLSHSQTPSPSPDSAQAVQAALDQLDQWLGQGDNGNRWRTYLHAEQLRAELAKGAKADPAIVADALSRLRGDANGLNLAPFASVANALTTWLAALREPLLNDLPGLAYASRGDHSPITETRFNEVRADLRTKLRALDAALARAPQVAAGWKTYLRWDVLQKFVADDFQPDARSLADLDQILTRFRANQVGLERPEFTDVAKAIAKYRALASWAATARLRDTRPVYERYLTDLQRLLERHFERPTMETVRQVARGVGTVDSLGQSPQLVTAVRQQFARSNIFGTVSANFIGRTPQQRGPVSEAVRDCILGTSISGTAVSQRNVRYELQESADSIVLAIYLDGQAQSRTRGLHKPVQVNSTGRTEFHAVKRISLSDSGFVSTSASASVDTRTRIHSIQKTGGRFGHRLVEKIAWKRAMEQKRQAELISAEHTRQRVLRDFDEIVARELGAARGRYELQVRAPLLRRGVTPEVLRMSSGPMGVMAEVLFGTRGQLGAAGPPPAMMPGHDLSLQVHESAVNNFLPLALASARISQQSADVPPVLQGNVPNWLKIMSLTRPNLAAAASAAVETVDEAQERIEDIVGAEPGASAPEFKPYSITLNGEAPASVRFDDGTFTIRVRASELASDERSYKNWDFIITYRITPRDDRILLVREGDIEVLPTGFDPDWPKQLTAEQTSFRSVLKRNMNDRAHAGQSFPKEIPIEPVRLSRFGVLVLRELVADDGWLTVGWGLP
jgi:hypothetical protein